MKDVASDTNRILSNQQKTEYVAKIALRQMDV